MSFLFGDNPDTGANPDNENRVVTCSYAYQDNILTTVEYLKGNVIGKRFTVFGGAGIVSEKVAVSPNATPTTAGNLLTVTWRYLQAGPNLSGDVYRIEHPDGTVTLTAASVGQTKIETILNGVYNGQSGITTGRKEMRETDIAGRLIQREVYDVDVSRSPVEVLLENEQYGAPDAYGGRTTVGYLGGFSATMAYGCCGLQYTVDRDGVRTDYYYDVLKRETATKQHDITTTNLLDAAGNPLLRWAVASGNQRLIHQWQYDSAGRVIAETNALGGVTQYAETFLAGSGRLQRTTTHLTDGGTEVQTFYNDGTPLETSGSAVAPLRYVYGVRQDGSFTPAIYATTTLAVRLDVAGGTNEWSLACRDMAGRLYKTLYAPRPGIDDPNNPPNVRSYYDPLTGQLLRTVDPDNVGRLFAYNARGEQVRTVVDVATLGQIDTAGTDRITDTLQDVLGAGDTQNNPRGVDIVRTRTFVYPTDNNGQTRNLVSLTETSTDKLTTWQTVYRDTPGTTAVTTRTQRTVPDANLNYTLTITFPDNSSQVSTYSNGRLVSAQRRDSNQNQVALSTYDYDSFDRQWKLTDARNGATTYGFDNADNVTNVTAPNPGTGESPQVTSTFYDKMNRVTGVQNPDGTVVTNLYFVTGLLQKTWGSRTYPVEYTYDTQGRMRTMKTWQNSAGNAATATTRWNYDQYRGWLAFKDYPDASTGQPPILEGTGGPTYTYTAAGRLSTRVWKRGITTTYGYNSAGDLASISYSDSTPGTTYSYDRRGRRSQVVRNGITTALTYNSASQPLTETYTGGCLAGLGINWAYDTSLRLQSLTAKNGATTLQGGTYGYDTAGRLQTVTDSPYTATYAYQPNSTLISTLTFTNTGAGGMQTTRTYDKLNRLTLTWSKAYGTAATNVPTSFAYQYNAANQRTRATLGDRGFWVYKYDALGQVVSGCRFWADGSPVAGQDFTYAFDDIGNRTSTGGRASAASTYTVNRLNQYSSRTVAPYVDVLGIANPTTNVTVNGTVANRKGEYFHWPLNVPNSTPQYPNLTIVSQYGATQTQTGAVYVAASTESFQPDADGNLASDGRWTYTWDGENRLVQMIRDTDTPAGTRQKLAFEYDHQGRRIRKQFFTYSGGWQEQTDTVFLCDGWNLVAELNANSSNAKVRSYVWGSDLSGSMRGAGGVGGLLKVTYVGASTTNPFVAYDGNGNVAALTDASNGNTCARYEYGPFAEAVRVTGPLAKLNPIRFSTKYTDDESGFFYYGYRYYNPSTGRWLSRDPIGEKGGANLYGMVGNNPVNLIDAFGLWTSWPNGGQHDTLTRDSLNTALAGLTPPLSDKCKKKLRETLVAANVGQDRGSAADDLPRHFNRAGFATGTAQEVQQRRTEARNAYAQYLQGEEVSFNYIPECWERLKALGRLSHSWQDYYGHGVHASQGFVDPITGSPSSFTDFWPSSYPGEHKDNRTEPVSGSSRRFGQAEAYVAGRFRRMINDWLASCRCICDQ